MPVGQYGVGRLHIEGAERIPEGVLKRCLLTVEQGRLGIALGAASEDCQAPPFDSAPLELDFGPSPWGELQGLNLAVLELDQARIERFYRARGFYDARVVEVRFEPPRAGDLALPVAAGACDPSEQSCEARVTIVVEEGEPLVVGRLELEGVSELPEALRSELLAAGLPRPGERFDELDYDRGKASLAEALAEASYVTATVQGKVVLDHAAKLAQVTYRVHPGAPHEFGRVVVEGQGELPTEPIVAAAAIEPGSPFRQSSLQEVQREVYALGAFSAVEVERAVRDGERVVDLRVRVVPLPRNSFRLSAGVASGALRRTASSTVESVPQWDVHFPVTYERRRVFGTLGKLRLEERPRLIFGSSFPGVRNQRLGNVLKLRFNEPGLLEARTNLVVDTLWDYGPDPFQGFFRSDIALSVGAERAFLRRKLFGRLSAEHDRYVVGSGEVTTDGDPVPSSYLYTFLEQELRLDLRDDQVRPHAGAFFSLRTSQALRAALSDWTIYRVAPDLRAYLPLPLQIVLAARVALAAAFVRDPNPELDATSRALGPNAYRLRGGGAQSNRGFIAGRLGVGTVGGIRRWESSLELRVPLGTSLGTAVFLDVGDVSDEPVFRFDEPNTSLGFGLRYATPIGILRADAGFRLDPGSSGGSLFGVAGAFHLTIGEAF